MRRFFFGVVVGLVSLVVFGPAQAQDPRYPGRDASPLGPFPQREFRPGPPPAPMRPPTLMEFATSFRPVPGTYEITLLHPRTGQPVVVCFTLPAGLPRKLHVDEDKLEYDYGRDKVKIHFEGNGRVKVENH